jgi:hypothetical protein
MRRILALAALLASSLALPAAPALAQDDTASCMAQMQAAVRPLLEQAGQFSPEGVRGQGFAPLTRPFAPPYYGSRFGPYPTAPWLPAPTAAYNTSAQLTAFSGLPQPGAIGFPPNALGVGGVGGVGVGGVGGVGGDLSGSQGTVTASMSWRILVPANRIPSGAIATSSFRRRSASSSSTARPPRPARRPSAQA